MHQKVREVISKKLQVIYNILFKILCFLNIYYFYNEEKLLKKQLAHYFLPLDPVLISFSVLVDGNPSGHHKLGRNPESSHALPFLIPHPKSLLALPPKELRLPHPHQDCCNPLSSGLLSWFPYSSPHPILKPPSV